MQIGKDTFLFLQILRNLLNMFQFETLMQKDNRWILKLLYLNQFTWFMVTFEKMIKFGKCPYHFSFQYIENHMDDGTSNLESKNVYQCWVVLIFLWKPLVSILPTILKKLRFSLKKAKINLDTFKGFKYLGENSKQFKILAVLIKITTSSFQQRFLEVDFQLFKIIL
jgi:hypothetical protein